MIEDWKELSLPSGAGDKVWEDELKSKMGVEISILQNAISSWTKENAVELAQDFPNLSPKGDYGNILFDPEEIIKFLQTTAIEDPSVWNLRYASFPEVPGTEECRLQLTFFNKNVDDGKALRGIVFLNKLGKIVHAFSSYSG
jgi:hypothetical protein